MQDMRLTKEQAEYLRLFIKEIRWASYNLEKFYESAKPEDAPKITKNPNQLEMFKDGKDSE